MYMNSKFADIMKSFPREVFKESTELHKGDRYSKKFSSYSHVVAMIYSHLSESGSLRAIELGYNLHENSHYHLQACGIKRSTLSDANVRRSPQIFFDTANHMMISLNRRLRKELLPVVKLIDSHR